ncbi:MAG: protein kinase [bacterium]
MSRNNPSYDHQVVNLLKTLGKAYLDNGENHKAAEKFRQLVNHGIDEPAVVLDYALALARCEATHPEALSIYEKAIASTVANETLYLTLATLFLKEDIIEAPALKVFRRALKYAPPFQEEIRNALEKIFHETTETVTTPEIRRALLDSIDNPELLSLYLSTSWKDGKFDDTLYILKDLYQRSNQNRIYLKAICQTLLEKKSRAEELGMKFLLSSSDLRYCFRYLNIEKPLNKIREVELYLDFKNLFMGFSKKRERVKSLQSEYKFFLVDNSTKSFQQNADIDNILFDIDSDFSLERDFWRKKNLEYIEPAPPSSANAAANRNKTKSLSATEVKSRIHSLAIFEISNYDADPEQSKLPFHTFLNLLAGEIAQSEDVILCAAEDGLFVFSSDAEKLFRAALNTLFKLERYNQVVDECEVIQLKVTLHASEIPFLSLENEGLRELRKSMKVHNLPKNPADTNQPTFSGDYQLIVTENMTPYLRRQKLNRLGKFHLPHLPNLHPAFEVIVNDTRKNVHRKFRSSFGKYEVSDTIKENSFYATYRGYDAQLERAVIIKVYNPQAFAEFKEFSLLRKQFFEEIRKLNRINHPNIAVIYDAGEDENKLYLVREYNEGQILNHYLLQRGLPEIKRTLEIYLKICKTLANFHAHQIWHKNLKPDNIFITTQEEIKLTDGGLLQVRHSNKLWHADIDSHAYSAPEQIQGLKLTQSCDVFQLGVMLYESLTGSHPFKARNASRVRIRILADEPASIRPIRPDLPPEVETVLMKSMAKDPNRRFQSIDQLAQALQKMHKNGI